MSRTVQKRKWQKGLAQAGESSTDFPIYSSPGSPSRAFGSFVRLRRLSLRTMKKEETEEGRREGGNGANTKKRPHGKSRGQRAVQKNLPAIQFSVGLQEIVTQPWNKAHEGLKVEQDAHEANQGGIDGCKHESRTASPSRTAGEGQQKDFLEVSRQVVGSGGETEGSSGKGAEVTAHRAQTGQREEFEEGPMDIAALRDRRSKQTVIKQGTTEPAKNAFEPEMYRRVEKPGNDGARHSMGGMSNAFEPERSDEIGFPCLDPAGG
uniref:Uncharacterized protein n=1 Tax=Chromera velia CCMP2878 TaxID=1169474 RepID=A0A0G4I3U3_9ALVE|eukprot:Cvel_10757.t1-p1 / transcript=Cvel_10757.t1 / gene=Cvel_10757 / organism=Chromera_velia_CCMP2878 / gene_product=hypothetical protein / transcript_product=hypothetical protein / location=Cvel_scaffold656:48357-51913(-) / protein_length=263 / sequence_SO=supercontig / SO=protein_coding / is_pseudo=false